MFLTELSGGMCMQAATSSGIQNRSVSFSLALPKLGDVVAADTDAMLIFQPGRREEGNDLSMFVC